MRTQISTTFTAILAAALLFPARAIAQDSAAYQRRESKRRKLYLRENGTLSLDFRAQEHRVWHTVRSFALSVLVLP
jgi:hypothetical protein